MDIGVLLLFILVIGAIAFYLGDEGESILSDEMNRAMPGKRDED